MLEKMIKLLMTETSPELCRLCKETMPAQGIEVSVCARNGAVAYSELVRQKPDAVLLDVFMPGMDAFVLKSKFDQNVDKIKELLGYGLSVRKIANVLGYTNHIALNTYIKKGFIFDEIKYWFYIYNFDYNKD